MLCLYFCAFLCSPFLLYRHTHTRLFLFAVCFTIIANTPLPSVHFTHDVAHLFTHLSELLCLSVCVLCIVSCHARLEQCWSTGQANGIWPCPRVLWHVGMQNSKLNRQELVHMAVWILMCQHCICKSSSGVMSTLFSLTLPSPLSLPTIIGANTKATFHKVWEELSFFFWVSRFKSSWLAHILIC